MLLGGLWHGASWNFLIWGGYHGGLLAVERIFRGDRPHVEKWGWLYPLKAMVTFGLVTVGWVFFRAADLPQSVGVLRQMFAGGPGAMLFAPWHLGLVALALVLAVLEEKLDWSDAVIKAPVWVYASALAAMLLFVELFGVIDAAIPFVYFQF